MPTGRHLPRGLKILMVIMALSVILLGVLISQGFLESKSEPAVTGGETVPTDRPDIPNVPFVAPAPTDTVVTGAIDAVGSGQGQDELYLVQKKGEKVTNTKLVIDEHSYCNMGSGGLPCIAMSITYSMAFGGKRALVDGNTEGDSIRVRRLRILDESETARVMPAGIVYIPWMQARTMILNCETNGLMQSHEGLVFITDKNGKKMTAVEPVIDEVFKVTQEASATCPDIKIGTE